VDLLQSCKFVGIDIGGAILAGGAKKGRLILIVQCAMASLSGVFAAVFLWTTV